MEQTGGQQGAKKSKTLPRMTACIVFASTEVKKVLNCVNDVIPVAALRARNQYSQMVGVFKMFSATKGLTAKPVFLYLNQKIPTLDIC